jgi:hypothetical protein
MAPNPKINEIYIDITNDPKNKVYKVIKGTKGINIAKKIMGLDDQWSSRFNSSEKKDALLIIYGITPRTKEKMAIKLLIGNGNNFSVIGEILK